MLLARLAAAVLAGGLLAQAHGLQPFWPLAWLAVAPLVAASLGATRSVAFLCGAIAGALSMALMGAYLLELGGPAPVAIITLAKALIWGGGALLVREAGAKLPVAVAVFALPAFLAGLDTLMAAGSPHGSAGSLAYSQMDFLPAIQVAAFGGAPLIVFVVTLFGSAIGFLVAKRNLLAAIAPALMVAAALGFGYFRLSGAPEGESRSVAMIVADQFEGVPQHWQSVWEAYAPQIERAADADFRIVVLPEKIAQFSPEEAAVAVERLAEIARRRDLLLVVGVDEQTAAGRYNRAYALSAAGVQSYDKRHMVPDLESHFDIGPGDVALEHDGLRFGLAVCKDMDFPALGRAYAGVDAMLVPAWDFDSDAWLHSRMAVLRGVENGYAIVRSARNGVLTVSDSFGRVTAEAPSGPLTALNVNLAAAGRATLYSRIGDAFGWAMLALTLALAGLSALRKPAD